MSRCSNGIDPHAQVRSILLAWVGSLVLAVSDAGGGVWYVDAGSGDDASVGARADRPFRTIQRACEVVAPGDTVIVGPGLYFAPIRLRRAGTAGAPITFRADRVAKGRVVVTAAVPQVRAGEVRWTLEDRGLALYSIPFEYLPVRGLYDGVDLMPYPTVEGLKTFRVSAQMPGPQHGMAFDPGAGRLYVRLHASGQYGPTDPNRHVMSLSPPKARGAKGEHLDTPHSFAWGILTEAPAHAVLDGFTFEACGPAAVYIRGSDVTVRNCWFLGCRFGVAGGPYSDNDRYSTDDVLVEHCDYTQFPAFRDLEETLRDYQTPARRAAVTRFFWFGRKGVSEGVPDPYEYETGLTLGMGTDWVVRNNHLHECFDALSHLGLGQSRGARIERNRFARIVDNPIETENHAADVTIAGNEIIDALCALSWQPLGGLPWPGPVRVYRNLILSTPAVSALWAGAGFPEAPFKLGAHDDNWKSYNRHMANVPRDGVAVPGAGFLVYNNTVVMPGCHFLERVNGTGSRQLRNFRFFNNIFLTDATMNRGLPLPADSGLGFDHNLFVATATTPPERALLLAGEGGLVRSDPSGAGFTDPSGRRFELRADSPARGAGVVVDGAPGSGRDLGAIAFDSVWPTLEVGPRVASLAP